MELTWLEDFLALAAFRNFSRAAEARNVTQPAFSRRIRALEAWIGTPLVVRAPQGVALNAAGEYLLAHAEALVRDIHLARRGALRAAGRAQAALSIAATHALSFTFFPGWVRAVAPLEAMGALNLVSDSMAACEKLLLGGEVDLLLCHMHPALETPLASGAFRSLAVGRDDLVPVSAPDEVGNARWTLPGGAATATRLLAYSEASGLGRILAAAWPAVRSADPVFTAPLAAALRTMASQGHGLAWLPRSLVAEDLAEGRLVEAGAGQAIPVEIRLFRPRHRQSAGVEAFWAAALAQAPGPAA
ncbi:LysR family transcriptional regulator [Roseomonas marmotae]|uniref:LysR family transcriptional regulator n=1 Tax=Roseomonas marmotae TaxID=2768161 RepID=A0ABS3K8M8_9PROT|nr:LysR substrate-binding domain-containing protein [Roseomonas marmotae]MBO1073822.1 LysR family transcriptional regulator [Roseomonas marmotae]QTI78548.1 LysR family transcriptional regulator [Roseomonas marmotae]